jgi:hypothetical protein
MRFRRLSEKIDSIFPALRQLILTVNIFRLKIEIAVFFMHNFQ